MATKSKRKSKRGGRRLGAGRKPSPVKLTQRELIDQVSALVAPAIPKLVGNLMQLADGAWMEEPDSSGDGETRRVYRRPPDRAANEYLLNRVLGKPTESVEVNDGTVTVVVKRVDRRIAGPASEPAEDQG